MFDVAGPLKGRLEVGSTHRHSLSLTHSLTPRPPSTPTDHPAWASPRVQRQKPPLLPASTLGLFISLHLFFFTARLLLLSLAFYLNLPFRSSLYFPNTPLLAATSQASERCVAHKTGSAPLLPAHLPPSLLGLQTNWACFFDTGDDAARRLSSLLPRRLGSSLSTDALHESHSNSSTQRQQTKSHTHSLSLRRTTRRSLMAG